MEMGRYWSGVREGERSLGRRCTRTFANSRGHLAVCSQAENTWRRTLATGRVIDGTKLGDQPSNPEAVVVRRRWTACSNPR
eukprot:5719814-Amphidinium_carterae.2